MLTRAIARSLMGLIPEKVNATITLLPDSASPTSVTIRSSWMKPMDVRLTTYGGVNLQGDETRINIPDHELNPTDNGREIRPRDQICVSGVNYIVLSARLASVRTVWECLCRKEMT